MRRRITGLGKAAGRAEILAGRPQAMQLRICRRSPTSPATGPTPSFSDAGELMNLMMRDQKRANKDAQAGSDTSKPHAGAVMAFQHHEIISKAATNTTMLDRARTGSILAAGKGSIQQEQPENIVSAPA